MYFFVKIHFAFHSFQQFVKRNLCLIRMSRTKSHSDRLQHYPSQWSALLWTKSSSTLPSHFCSSKTLYWLRIEKPCLSWLTQQDSNEALGKQRVTFIKIAVTLHWNERAITSRTISSVLWYLKLTGTKLCP